MWMTEIATLQQILFERRRARLCPSGCRHPNPCTCSIVADIQAHMRRRLPRGYENCTIEDFTGAINGVDVISQNVARKAKEQLSQYIWGDPSIWLKKRENPKFDLDKYSVMDHRLDCGSNVVIYGDCEKSGRTMIATILLREAIRGRVHRPSNQNHHYGWLEFADLKQMLGDKDNEQARNYRFCEWLVVDNITEIQFEASPASCAYIQGLIDPFFFGRWKAGLVTVLIFKVNIESRDYDIERYLGVGINRIVSHPDTFKISLCEDTPDGR